MIKARLSTSTTTLNSRVHSLSVPADSQVITPVYFVLENENGLPIANTSNVFIKNSADEVVTPLTFEGNCWRLDMDSTSFGLGDVELNVVSRKQMRVIVEQFNGGVYERDYSEEFTLALTRFSAFSFVGLSNYFTWISPYDRLDTEVGTAILSMPDKSLSGNPMANTVEANSPVLAKYDYNFPFLEFDEDKLSSNLNIPVDTSFDLYAVISPRDLAGGIIITAGTGANKMMVDIGGGSLEVMGFNSLSAVLGSITAQQVFLLRVNYNVSTNTLSAQLNNGTPATDTGGTMFATGKLVIGDNGTDTHNKVGFGDVIMFNSILSSGDNNKIANALAAKYNITLA